MALSDSEVDRQINQMASFILEEAKAKAQEINVKAEEEFQKELSKTVQDARQKLLKDYERKRKAFETKKQIAYSNELNQSRLKVLAARSAVVTELTEATTARLNSITSNQQQYKATLKLLIAQGLLTLMEPIITLQCRQADEGLVKAVLSDAIAEYKQKMQSDVNVTLDTKSYLPPAPTGQQGVPFCNGGVILTALGGRITCDNTLDARLRIAVEMNQPEIRTTLFGASETRKYFT